jgi:hypothetical protein
MHNITRDPAEDTERRLPRATRGAAEISHVPELSGSNSNEGKARALISGDLPAGRGPNGDPTNQSNNDNWFHAFAWTSMRMLNPIFPLGKYGKNWIHREGPELLQGTSAKTSASSAGSYMDALRLQTRVKRVQYDSTPGYNAPSLWDGCLVNPRSSRSTSIHELMCEYRIAVIPQPSKLVTSVRFCLLAQTPIPGNHYSNGLPDSRPAEASYHMLTP